MGTILLGDLEKVGWVVLKCAYEIINGSDTQQHFYHLNNNKFPKNKNYWNKINGTNREMLYDMRFHTHEQRLCEPCDLNTNLPDIFQSDCDVINHHLHVYYNCDILENKYKYFLPNILRHNGYVNIDQILHLDYNHKKKNMR